MELESSLTVTRISLDPFAQTPYSTAFPSFPSDPASQGEEESLTIFQHLIKPSQMLHDDLPMLLQDRQRNEQMEVAAHIIRPQALPQPQHVRPFKFAFVPDEQHAEEEEKIRRIGFLEVEIEGGVHELDEVIEGEKLGSHAGLVAEEVALLAITDQRERPQPTEWRRRGTILSMKPTKPQKAIASSCSTA